MKRITKVLDIDGEFRESPDFPVAVVREAVAAKDSKTGEGRIIDPVYDAKVYNNLYGRMMTLLEATIEPQRLKAVKDVFSKELWSWNEDVYRSAREVIDYRNRSTPDNNIYTR